MRIVIRTLRAHMGASAVVALLVLFLAAIATIIPGYAHRGETQLVEAQLAAARPVERTVTVRGSIPVGGGSVLTQTVDQLREAVRAAVPEPALTEVVTVDVPVTADGTATTLTSRDGACEHLVLEGACYAGPNDVIVPDTLGRKPGDTVAIHTGGAARVVDRTLTVTGVYRTAAVRDAYWADRGDSPVLAGQDTVDGLAAQDNLLSGKLTLDLIALDATKLPTDLTPLHDSVAALQSAPPTGFSVFTRLPELADRIAAARTALVDGLTATSGQLLIAGGFVLLLALGFAAVARRPHATLALLRGAPPVARWGVALGPSLLVTIATGLVGVAAGFAIAGQRPGVVEAGRALGVLAVVTVGVAIAEAQTFRVPVMTGLRLSEPVRRRFAVSEILAVVLAAASAYQVVNGGGGIAPLAPALVLLAAGLVLGRLVTRATVSLGAAWLRAGRLAPGLAAVRLARRPQSTWAFALVVVAVAGIAQAAVADDATNRALRDRARLELGGDRVLRIAGATPATAVRAAVHAADPSGKWALAASRDDLGAAAVVAVEADRLAAVADFDASRLHPAVNPALVVDGARLKLSTVITSALTVPASVAVALERPDGSMVRTVFSVGPGAGSSSAEATVDGCTTGCRLAYLGFESSADDIRLIRLTQLGPDRELLSPADFGSPGRWRGGFTTSPTELTVLHGEGWLSMHYEPDDPRHIVTDLRVLAADAPLPLPVLAAGPARLGQTDEVVELPVGSEIRPVYVAAAMSGLPGVGASGYLVDQEYADRLAPSSVGQEVWLAPGTPASIVDALRSRLPVVGEETVSDRVNRMRAEGPGEAARLALLTAILAVLLAAGGIGVIAAAEHRPHISFLRALRTQGLSRRDAVRSAIFGPAGIVVAGSLTGAVLGLAVTPLARAALPIFVDGWTATPTSFTPGILVAVGPALLAALILLGMSYAGSRRVAAALSDRPAATPVTAVEPASVEVSR